MKKKKTFSASDCRAKLVESLFSSLREMFGNEAAVVLVGSDFWKECVEELKKTEKWERGVPILYWDCFGPIRCVLIRKLCPERYDLYLEFSKSLKIYCGAKSDGTC